MEKESHFFSLKNIGVLAIVTIITLLFAIFLYCHWKNSIVDDENGYNSINAVIALVALVFNVLTVLAIFVTFKNGKEEFNSTKEDTEFNRAIDLIYKQLSYTEDKIKKNPGFQSKIDLFIRETALDTTSIEKRFNSCYQDCFFNAFDFFHYLSNELEMYYNISNFSNLSLSNRKFLMRLVVDNMDSRYFDKIGIFQSLYFTFKQSETFKKVTKEKQKYEDMFFYINDIDYNLNLVLGYLQITKIDGLDLGD